MPRPKGSSKIICFYVTPETHKAIKRIALDRDTTLQDLLLGMVEREIEGGGSNELDAATQSVILKTISGKKLKDSELALLADSLNLDQRKLTESRDKHNGKHSDTPCAV